MKLVFKKLANKWYCDLPDYTGSVEDLQMVAGADILCEELPSYSVDKKVVEISTDPYSEEYLESFREDDNLIKLEFIEEGYSEWGCESGATYRVTGNIKYSGIEIWLCNVTTFVFDGEFPEVIYFKPIL